MSFLSDKQTVHVEVQLWHNKHLDAGKIRDIVEPMVFGYLRAAGPVFLNNSQNFTKTESDSLTQIVRSILLEQDDGADGCTSGGNCKYRFHYYMPQPLHSRMENVCFDGPSGGLSDQVVAANHYLLPASEFVGLWENLIFPEGMKEKLLKFALSALSFSRHNVNANVVSCNRLLLLHGPPGTGKTSLCRALAQKLAIRTENIYTFTHLVEINSHSLFSKWFSESGKLVSRLFDQLGQVVGDPHNLVCVLIDEVESLAYDRSSMSSNEPKDAMRVVNALLTQLDDIKCHPNVFIMATSNLSESIDLAFLDRADIKQFIGMPEFSAIKNIYTSMLLELMQTGLLKREPLGTLDSGEDLLSTLAKRSVGLSGRTLRKLPLLAYAEHTSSEVFEENAKIGISDFLDAMMLALDRHLSDSRYITKEPSS